jgi:hypothetical protein
MNTIKSTLKFVKFLFDYLWALPSEHTKWVYVVHGKVVTY